MENEIFIVGIGPGDIGFMSENALEAIKKSDVVVGYSVYVELVKKYFPQKEFILSGMRHEIERCTLCFELALQGKNIALVCSGDAGVYGMASPMFFLKKENEKYSKIKLTVVPGISACLSGSAVLGAPLGNDFCVISLSDLMIPYQLIEKRLKAAVSGDFSICIYNPSSHKRKDYLKKACRILLDCGVEKERACAWVKNIGREGEISEACTLDKLIDFEADMFTTVFIGNSQSEIFTDLSGKSFLITKRGYKI